ncbi:MAG TPA: chemotaxis protein CheA [Planctomycetota bacterium]|nr:chemotaxis protein CheA [Planctomycetota bacterium]
MADAEVPVAQSVALAESLEWLAGAVVLADPTDLPGLAALHTGFEQVAGMTAQALTRETAKSAAGMVEKLVLGEGGDPAAVLQVLGRAVSAIRALDCDGRGPAEVEIPPELGVKPPAEAVPGADAAILAEFLSRQPAVLEEFESQALEYEKTRSPEALAVVRRILHNLKGEAALLGLGEVEHLCHRTEDILANGLAERMTDLLLGVKDWLARAFAHRSGTGAAPEPADRLLDSFTGGPAATPGTAKPAESAGTPAAAPAAADLPLPAGFDVSLCGDFIAESRDHLDAADVHLLTLETEPENAEAMAAVFRAFHTIKGVAGFLGLAEIGGLAHQAENLLDRARKGELALAGAAMDAAFEAGDALRRLIESLAGALGRGAMPAPDAAVPGLLDRLRLVAAGGGQAAATAVAHAPGQKLGEILVQSGAASREAVEAAARIQQEPQEKKKLGDILVESAVLPRKSVEAALEKQAGDPARPKLGEVLVQSGAVSPEEVGKALEKQLEPPQAPKLGEILVREGQASARDVAAALRAQKGPAAAQAVQVKETVKVDADRLDRLLDAIGELVIAESMVSQSTELKSAASPQLERHLGQLDKITRELQEMGTSLRMVPVKATFQKMARLVRDLAKKAGKQIDFITGGEETELDKSVVDLIGDPLVHMIRNAVDHGVEPADERRRAGKPESGRIELRAFHKGGNIHIEMTDDGRGLQRDLILAKAREKGLLKSGETPPDHEVFNLIFLPGFSTAKVVSDVSGRGVGMDVVRKNIEALRGAVDIQSQAGKGTTFTIRLPLTLAIIDGMVVRLGRERYIIPTLSVVRAVRPKAEDVFSVLGRGEMLRLQGDLIPLFRLDRLFAAGAAEQDATRAVAVLVEDEGRQAAVLVDELLGQQQIVIKNLGETMKGTQGLSGAAIMPDGTVGLILDVGGLVKLANSGSQAEKGDAAA